MKNFAIFRIYIILQHQVENNPLANLQDKESFNQQ